MQKSTSLRCELSSELFLITAKQLFLDGELYLAIRLQGCPLQLFTLYRFRGVACRVVLRDCRLTNFLGQLNSAVPPVEISDLQSPQKALRGGMHPRGRFWDLETILEPF